jgi:hypothetical protein
MKRGFTISNPKVNVKNELEAPFFLYDEEIQGTNIGGESNACVVLGLGRAYTLALSGENCNS